MRQAFKLTPVVTEKSTLDANEQGVYQFKVPTFVNKIDIENTFRTLKEKVAIKKIAMLTVRKKVRQAGKRMMTKRQKHKKVFVYLADKNVKLDLSQFSS